MMRTASQGYEQRQDELKKQRAERTQRENNAKDESDTNLVFELINDDELTEVKEPEAGLFLRLILKLFLFVEGKPTQSYHEYR
jgi:hypothetical protein